RCDRRRHQAAQATAGGRRHRYPLCGEESKLLRGRRRDPAQLRTPEELGNEMKTRAAIYARKSTSQADLKDEEKSVTRQISLAKAFADERGWKVVEEYVDDGVSGQLATKLVNRARMLADATAGKFTVVIVRDFDRISRDDREGPRFVYDLQDAG